MTKNIGSVDRLIRFVVGLGMLAAFFLFPETPWRWVGILGMLPLMTAITESCLLYSMFGYSTCKCATEES